MIQRIQSLYLLLTAILYGFMFFFPFCILSSPENAESVKLFVHQIIFLKGETATSEWQILPLILTGLLIVSSLITIFLFKNRMLQYKLTRFFVLLGTGLIISLIFSWDSVSKAATGLADVRFSFIIIIPVLSLVFFYLANKAIIRDEKTIRSASRLR